MARLSSITPSLASVLAVIAFCLGPPGALAAGGADDGKGESPEAKARVEAKVTVEHKAEGAARSDFSFERVPAPSRGDAASAAAFTLVDGERDRNGGDLEVLHDGRLPDGDDEPSRNFFLAAGTPGGRLRLDFGRSVRIDRVSTYSWHPTTRGPQVYTLFASAGTADGFNAEPKGGTDPVSCGWDLVASVDTRPADGRGGGQYGVSIATPEGSIGSYRYLLFDISRTESEDPFGNTFYSEIDVVSPDVEVSASAPDEEAPREDAVFEIAPAEGKYRVTFDTSGSPDLTDWARKDLAPVVAEWYPKIVDMLPGEDYEAPREFSITISDRARGVAATSGSRIRCAGAWFRRNLEGEAKGAVVHELVHVVQRYGRARRRSPDAVRPPGWLVGGIADHIRWFLYEPESRGAEITRRSLERARYDASYRVSANFLDWVTRKHDSELVKKLNAACREGNYREGLWKELTGHTVEELAEAWKADLAEKLSAGDAAEE